MVLRVTRRMTRARWRVTGTMIGNSDRGTGPLVPAKALRLGKLSNVS